MRTRSIYLFSFIVILILITIFFAPWLLGIYFKKEYSDFLNVVAKESKTKINILEFHSGLLTSKAKVLVEPLNTENKSYGVTLDQTIDHGPIVYDYTKNRYTLAMASVRTIFHIDPMFEGLILGLAPKGTTQNILQVDTLKTFSGEYVSHFKTIAISTEMPGMGKIDWQGISGNASFKIKDQQITQANSSVLISAINAHDENGTSLITSDLTIQGESNRHSSELWNGYGELLLPLVSFTRPPNDKLTLEDFKFKETFGVKNNFYHIDLGMSIAKLEAINALTINSSNLNLSFNNLNANTILELTKSDSTDAKIYEDLALQLITPSTKILGNFEVNTSAGKSTGTLDVGWAQTDFPKPITPELLYQKANYKIGLRAAISLVNYIIAQTDKQIVSKQTPVSAENAATALQKPNLEEEVHTLVQQGKIANETAETILNLQKANLSLEVYTSSINGLTNNNQLTPEIAAVLIDSYSKSHSSTLASAPPVQPTPTTASSQQKLDQLIKQGYIVKDGNDYVVNIVGEQGKIKINGVDYKGEVPLPAAGQQ